MKQQIEITTAHNIVIKYELASVMSRVISTFIDIITMGIYAIIMALVFSSIPVMMYLLIFLPIGFYHLIFEWLNNGQSPGKILLKLKVVSLKSQSLTTEDLVMRWVFRLIDITTTIGSLGILAIISTDKSQRIGDIMAGTTVIQLQPNKQVVISDFDKMEASSHQVKYPGVIAYTDKDMLLIKDALQHVRKHPYKANKEVLVALTHRISKELGLQVKRSEIPEFLQQVIKDYIVMTR